MIGSGWEMWTEGGLPGGLKRIGRKIVEIFCVACIAVFTIEEGYYMVDIKLKYLDFVQENCEWKIDEIEMRKLKECIWTPFYTRLKLELGFSIATGIDFEKVLIKDLNLAVVRLFVFCFNLIFILAYLKI